MQDDLTKSIKTETKSELTKVATLQQQIKDLQKTMNKLHTDLSCKIRNFQVQKFMQDQNFYIDRFKHNTTYFKFYIGFESFYIFKAVLDHLNPAANSQVYWRSISMTFDF